VEELIQAAIMAVPDRVVVVVAAEHRISEQEEQI